MKKLLKKINNTLTKLAVRTELAIENCANSSRAALANRKGEEFVGSAIGVICSVVIGGLFLGGLYALFKTGVIPTMTEKVTGFFNYSGT